MTRSVVFAVAIAAAAGCTPYTIGRAIQPPVAAFGPARAGVGTVCVIRSSAFARGVTFVVHDNQTLVGATKGDSYFCYEAEPGAHAIVSDTFDSTDRAGRLDAAIEPGGRYYVLQDHENHLGSITSRLAWLDPQTAADTIAHCEYRPIVEAPAHEPLPPPVPFAVASR